MAPLNLTFFNNFSIMKIIRILFPLSLLLAFAAFGFAQTNGTLTGTTTSYNYSTAPWIITSGPGTYPDGGGTATFNPIIGATPGTAATFTNVAIDVSPTLSQIIVNSPFYYNLTAVSGSSIIAANTGLTVNAQSTAQNISNAVSIISVPVGFAITAPISGGGTAGLTKIGSGNLYLGGTNTYTGGTHINGGLVNLAGGDAALGATGAGNGLSFNGGAMLFSVGGASARDIFIDTGGATLLSGSTTVATTLSGVISGSGTLTNLGFSGTSLTLTGTNTYTGATIARANNVITTLSGAGSIATSSSYDLMGTFTLDNSGTNGANRLSDTAAMSVRGINFVTTGNAVAASSETIGAVTGANSLNTFLVTPGTGQANSLTMASLARQNNATFAFRGAGLGGTPGAGVANIYSTAAPSLIGGGGGAGSTNISILPYAFGNNTTSVLFTAAGLVNSSLVTYDANGFRPLATTEYATTFGVNNTDNVRLTAATAAGSGVTANSVVFAPAAAATLSGGPINITSGAFLYSPTANVTGTVSAGLNFGAAEGVIMNTSALVVSGVLSGSNGLTLSQGYAPTSTFTPTITLSGANTYTGNTTINSGLVAFSGTVATGTAGAFGTSGTIILDAGNNLAGISPTAATTFNRDISVIGSGNNYISAANSGYAPTFNGNISLAGNLFVYGFSNAAANAMNFNGVISGTGTIYDNGTTYGVFTGNNTYSGGTILNTSTYYAGSDTAFGTGTFTFRGAGALAGVGTTARTIANPVFINAVNATFGGAAPLTLTGDVNLNGSSTITATNTALTTFSGTVGSGAITKGGTGAVAFNSSTGNTFTGGFVNTGAAATSSAIYVNNTSGSGLGTGAVSIGAASATTFSTLAGNFTLAGTASIAGRLSPGNGTGLTSATAGTGSIGTENFNGALTLSSATTSSLFLEANGATSFDRINVAGLLTLNGTVNFVTINGFVASAGMSFDLVDWGTINVGSFTVNTSNAMSDPGTTFDTSNFATNGTISVVAVPEPSAWAMIASGAGMLATVLRFRRRRLS